MRYAMIGRTLVLSACLAWPAIALAQPAGKDRTPTQYQPAAERTVSGVVAQVISATGADGTVGVHLNLKTPDGTVRVHIAPALFIGENNFWFQIDDQIQVTGADVQHTGVAAFWAREIKKGNETLKVRDNAGTPLWKYVATDPDGCGISHEIIR